MAGFLDIFVCPKCGRRSAIYRQGKSAGKMVQTYCSGCGKMVKVKAGEPHKRDDIGVSQ